MDNTSSSTNKPNCKPNIYKKIVNIENILILCICFVSSLSLTAYVFVKKKKNNGEQKAKNIMLAVI